MVPILCVLLGIQSDPTKPMAPAVALAADPRSESESRELALHCEACKATAKHLASKLDAVHEKFPYPTLRENDPQQDLRKKIHHNAIAEGIFGALGQLCEEMKDTFVVHAKVTDLIQTLSQKASSDGQDYELTRNEEDVVGTMLALIHMMPHMDLFTDKADSWSMAPDELDDPDKQLPVKSNSAQALAMDKPEWSVRVANRVTREILFDVCRRVVSSASAESHNPVLLDLLDDNQYRAPALTHEKMCSELELCPSLRAKKSPWRSAAADEL